MGEGLPQAVPVVDDPSLPSTVQRCGRVQSSDWGAHEAARLHHATRRCSSSLAGVGGRSV